MATTTAEIPTKIPPIIYAGARIKWLRDLPDYLPANGWTLKYAMTKDGVAPITFDASDNGDGRFLVDLAVTTSQDFAIGEFMVQEYIEDSPLTDRRIIQRAYIEVAPLFADEEDGYDTRPHSKKVLDAINALLEGKATKDQLSYSIAGRSVSRMTPGELIEWKNHYEMLWRQDQAKLKRERGKASGNRVLARFRT